MVDTDDLYLPQLAVLWYGKDTPTTRSTAAHHALRLKLGMIEQTQRGPVRRVSRAEAEANRPRGDKGVFQPVERPLYPRERRKPKRKRDV